MFPENDVSMEDPEEECYKQITNDATYGTGTGPSKTAWAFYPPRFWDTLSIVRLTRGALAELDRREAEEGEESIIREARILLFMRGDVEDRSLLRSDTRFLKKIASQGGPDLSLLRGFVGITSQLKSRIAQYKLELGLPPGTEASASWTCTSMMLVTPHGMLSHEYEQKLIDRGVYPIGYRDATGRVAKPRNIDQIRNAFRKRRSSLQSSRFFDPAFEEILQKMTAKVTEPESVAAFMSVLAGDQDDEHFPCRHTPLSHLQGFDDDIVFDVPLAFYGAHPAQIEPILAEDLDTYIMPSGPASLPAAPNFFVQRTNRPGLTPAARRSILHDGALGARGILYLQNYGKFEPEYDGHAYVLSCAWHAQSGFLEFYATFPKKSSQPGRADYYVTCIGAYALLRPQGFHVGATAFRNARDWTKAQRDRIIAEANKVAQNMSEMTDSIRSQSVSSSPAMIREECLSPESADTKMTSETSTMIECGMSDNSEHT